MEKSGKLKMKIWWAPCWGWNKTTYILQIAFSFSCICQKKFTFCFQFHWMKFVPNGSIDNEPALIQVMAWHGTGNQPLPDSILTYCKLKSKEQMKFLSKWIHFSRKCIWKVHLQNVSHFCPGLNMLTHWGEVTHTCMSILGHHCFVMLKLR